MPKTLYIYGDESGSLADITNHVFIVALVTTLDPTELRFIVKKVHKQSLSRKGKRYKERRCKEFKSHTAFGADQRKVLMILRNKEVKIFALSIKKGRKKVVDSPLNYGIAIVEIIEALLKYYKGQDLKFALVLDRHFTNKAQIDKLNQVIVGALKVQLKPQHVNSQGNPFVAIADFIAGALREEFSYHNKFLSSLIADKIVFKKEILWSDLKRKWIGKIKK